MDGYARQARPDLRPRRAARRDGDGRRLARRRLRRPGGRGTPEHYGVIDRVDVLTGTLGKAIGGASGGYVAGRREIVELLRQRSRPYLFSNSVAPPIVAASLAALDLIERSDELRDRLRGEHRRFRAAHDRARIRRPAGRPPDRAGDDRRRAGGRRLSQALVEHGVYAVASPTRSCRSARPASAPRCRPRTRTTTSTSRCGRSSPRGTRPASSTVSLPHSSPRPTTIGVRSAGAT